MQDVIELEIPGAKLIIPSTSAPDGWLAKARLRRSMSDQLQATLPRLGEFCLEQGGVYAGIVRGEKDCPSYHLFHATIEHEIVKAKWKAACEKASAPINGFSDWSLPDRREARLLSINSPDSFDLAGWYWTSTQDAADPVYAWIQVFADGYQDLSHKSDEYRARPVRRVLIIE